MPERPNPKLKLNAKKRKADTTTNSSRDRNTDTDASLHLTETFQTLIDNNNTHTTLPPTRHEPHPDFLPTLTHLSQTLFKLVSLTTGQPHPSCPDSVLRYHLLTSTQLDDIARHYHQIWPPVPETYRYPKPIKPWLGTEEEHTIDVELKRERIGQFIGLRRGIAMGLADITTAAGVVEAVEGGKNQLIDLNDEDGEDEEEEEKDDVVKTICERIRVQMQKDWEEALERARRDEGYPGIVRLTKA